MKELLQHPFVKQIIELSFAEDIGEGDHTSLASIPANAKGKSIIVAKEAGIIAGVTLAEHIFKLIDPSLEVKLNKKDGDEMQVGDVIIEIAGSSISMLTAERTVLNFMQRLSGISTQTNKYTQILKGLHAQILDTRKTTPGMRILEKWAVKNGGGVNHRFGLYDMILLKDNHVDFAGGIKEAIASTHRYLYAKNLKLKVEIETRSIDEIKQVLEVGGVDRIMLDNFSVEMMKEGVALINGRFETEASGGITLETLRSYAETGVDYISSGALTHSIKSIDLSMRAV